MKLIKLFLQRIFTLDPELVNVGKRTDVLAATLNGDTGWMLSCKPKTKIEYIECDNGKTYKEES